MWFKARSRLSYIRAREAISAVNAELQESVAGVRVTQSLGRTDNNEERFAARSAEYRDARLRSMQLMSVYFAGSQFLSTVAKALVLWYGAHLVGLGTLTTGLLIAFLLYLDQFFSPLQQLSAVFDQWNQARISLGRLDELLATPSSTPEAADAVEPGEWAGDVVLEGVRFAYSPDARRGAARHRPARARGPARRPGRHDGCRQVDVRQARRPVLRPDGRERCSSTATTCATSASTATAATSATCRRSRSCSPARSARTSPTDARMPPTSTSSERRGPSAPTSSCDGCPDGYHTAVSETGRSLSAGQRQLLCLARAELVDPAILILDEATSNLDLATEAQVQRAMHLASQGRTTLLIAHRLQTARSAARIVVVEEGRIVEDGSHDELVAAGGRYAELWDAFDSSRPEPGTLAGRVVSAST